MADEQVPIKILIPVEEESPHVPEQTGVDIKGKARRAGQKIAQTSKTGLGKVWRSGARKKVTSSIGRGASAVVTKGGKVMQDVVVKTAGRQAKKRALVARERIQSTDWKQEAKTGTAAGLRWVSLQLAQLANRFTPADQKGPEKKADN